MTILHVDENHPLLWEGFEALGHRNVQAYDTPLDTIRPTLNQYEGLIIRSRFPVDKSFLNQACNLQFIGRVGAGLENIDTAYARQKDIALLAAPEGNQNAVGEHTLGLLLGLLTKQRLGHLSIQAGNWLREAHRGWELAGKTVGIIGYGHMGRSFAQKLSGMGVRVLCHDRIPNRGDAFASQVPLETLYEQAQVISLHTDQNPSTQPVVNTTFIQKMQQPFWLLNTARGSAVDTQALVEGLRSGKVLGAGLDVLEYESKSFHSIFQSEERPQALNFLLQADNVLLSPHVGGWTMESHKRLASVILNKFKSLFH
ncbi:MAG: NAD(P)-dependent oxidoreductase [Flavobacteriaceae bacterium]